MERPFSANSAPSVPSAQFSRLAGCPRFAFLPGSWGFFNVAQTFLSVLLGFSSLKLKT